MTQDFQRLLASPDYDFLRAHERLGNRMMILGLSGSYGYGTNREGSDIDLRGVTMQRASDLLGLTTFEQYTDERTDTVVFGFNKFVQLLLQCNPNCCEILGLPRDSYLILSPLGEKLLEHQSLFFSKRAIQSFGGYASDQLRRLQNALARDSLPQSEREKHILNAAQRALDDFSRRNSRISYGSIRLYIDQARIGQRTSLSMPHISICPSETLTACLTRWAMWSRATRSSPTATTKRT